MEKNQRDNRNQSSTDRTQQDQTRNQQNDWNNESQNTASGLRNEMKREQDESGSGRSYDYGTEGSSEEDTNQQLGRNSNQQNVSNPLNTPGTGNDNMPGRSDSRAGTGSGTTTKQSVSGSDYDGQNRNS
jgi:hypothetical protein